MSAFTEQLLDEKGILVLTLARPKVNALNVAFMNEISNAFSNADRDPNVKGVLIRSNFKTFCAGLDLLDLHELTEGKDAAPRLEDFYSTLLGGFCASMRCSKPVAAALNGHGIAGGMILALGADFLSLSTRLHGSFKMGLTELSVGVPFPSLPLRVAAKKLSSRAFTHFVYGAENVPVEEAHSKWGVGDSLASDAEAEVAARGWLERVTGPGRTLDGFGITKRLYWADVLDREATARERAEWVRAILSDECRGTMRQLALFAKSKL